MSFIAPLKRKNDFLFMLLT